MRDDHDEQRGDGHRNGELSVEVAAEVATEVAAEEPSAAGGPSEGAGRDEREPSRAEDERAPRSADDAEAGAGGGERPGGGPDGEPGDGDAVPGARGPGPGDGLSDEELDRQVLALIFASPEPLGTGRLLALLERPRRARLEESLERIGRRLVEEGSPLRLRALAGGWRVLTAPELADVVARLHKTRKIERISPAALETLAIVAYRQPVTKAEIESIRGVQAGAILRSLVERGLCRITGRADQPGAPLQYGTTREFLDRFGLESLQDLPRDGELMRD